MKKNLLILLWALTPVALLAWHYGPGQDSLARDSARAKIEEAVQFEADQQWRKAVAAYTEALAELPEADSARRHRLRLAHANARIHVGELPEAMAAMESLLDEVKTGGDAALQREVRASLASTQYYAGWLMRLELAEKDEWMEPVGKARQNFRWLAEQTVDTDTEASEAHQKNLEAVIRLARMDLSELQGLPLPKKCEGCKNVCSKCRGQKKSRKPKEMKKKEDARGASVGKRPEGTGS